MKRKRNWQKYEFAAGFATGSGNVYHPINQNFWQVHHYYDFVVVRYKTSKKYIGYPISAKKFNTLIKNMLEKDITMQMLVGMSDEEWDAFHLLDIMET